MKRILLITFYYPPYTGIEGNRLNSWAKALTDAGHHVTVLTRQWKAGGAQSNWGDYIAEYREAGELTEIPGPGLRVIRLPHTWGAMYRAARKTPLSGVYYWWSKARGRLHIETDAYNSFHDYAMALLRREEFDLCIVSSPPLNIIRLGYELGRKTGIPFIADFRDSYSNFLLNPSLTLSRRQRLENIFFRQYLRHWLAPAAAIITVTKEIADTISPSLRQPVAIVRNGYEHGLFDAIPDTMDRETFTITLTGSLYPEQDIAFFCRSVQQFIKREQPRHFKVRFIGIKGRMAVTAVIRKYIPEAYLDFTDRLPREMALRIMRESCLLFQVGWRGYKGYCPGKVFEYMASGRNILVAPADDDLTDRLVQETGTGYSAHTEADAATYIGNQYQYWLRHRSLPYEGRPEEIAKYSREAQNTLLLALIDSSILK